MSWHDVNLVTSVIAVGLTLIPLMLTFIAARVGYKQVREFHEHTGDDSLLASVTAFSRFHEEPVTEKPVAARRHKEPESALS